MADLEQLLYVPFAQFIPNFFFGNVQRRT